MGIKTPDRPVKRMLRALFVAAPLVAACVQPAFAQGLGLEELREMMSWRKTALILFEKLEYVPQESGRPVVIDAVGWYGGAYDRLWFRAEGEQSTTERVGEGEAHLYYGRLITPYWDALAGVRVDQRWGDDRRTRAHLAVGLTGLAPLRFEVSPTLFLSRHGHVAIRLEAEYSILITQRLALQPDVEVNAALQEVPEWGVWSGMNDFELGLRLGYEVTREFAPYVGVAWMRRLGGAADVAREEGETASGASFVAGVRVWR